MFYRCHSLDKLPDITKWNINNIQDVCLIFYGCSPSLFIDDLNKWNKNNVLEIINDFNNAGTIFDYELHDNDNSLLKKKNKMLNDFNNIDNYIICKKCNTFPLISFSSFNILNITCNCLNNNNKMNINEFYNNYITQEDNIKKEYKNLFFCDKHYKKFKYYCIDCKEDLCKICLKETSLHTFHQMDYFDVYIYNLNIKLENIKEKFYQTINKNEFEKLIMIICNNYNNYYNYNLIKSIENIYNFIFFKGKELVSINEIKNEQNLNCVISIIVCEQNVKEIKIFCNENLINLELLILKDNYIDDISPLIYANFQNLKKLNLENNKIGDTNIQYFKQMNFKRLTELNVNLNCLSDFKFFNTIINFPRLNILYAAKNDFNKNINETIINNNNIINLSQIKEIRVSNGVFSDSNIKILSIFKFNNLQILNLAGNNLNSLTFVVENLECSKLEELKLNNNYIKEFMPLKKYKNLKKIDISENKINDISKLINLIKELKQLIKINIRYNLIDTNDIKNIKLLNYIKNELNIKLLV